MRLMRALKCDASKGELSLEDVSIPEVILPDDIVIKVGYAGLCGTDLHIMQGEFAVCGSSKVVDCYKTESLCILISKHPNQKLSVRLENFTINMKS